jgi:outer membrane lipopolysaccharide assembly protein LptE/RlpB
MAMAYIRTCAALIVLLGTASCAFDRADRYNMSGMSSNTSIYSADKPAPMDRSVRVATQDCSKAVTLDRGNLYCNPR